MTAPQSADPSTGVALPLVALPQTDLLTVNEIETPWPTDAFGDVIDQPEGSGS